MALKRARRLYFEDDMKNDVWGFCENVWLWCMRCGGNICDNVVLNTINLRKAIAFSSSNSYQFKTYISEFLYFKLALFVREPSVVVLLSRGDFFKWCFQLFNLLFIKLLWATMSLNISTNRKLSGSIKFDKKSCENISEQNLQALEIVKIFLFFVLCSKKEK